jgi:hypothetical protein
MIMAAMRSYASSVTWADGLAAAQAVGTSVWRESFIPDKKPATGILMPVTASNRLVPRDLAGGKGIRFVLKSAYCDAHVMLSPNLFENAVPEHGTARVCETG